jgi:hypothetical protein
MACGSTVNLVVSDLLRKHTTNPKSYFSAVTKRLVTLGGWIHQFVRVVAVLEQMNLVDRGSSSNLDETVLAEVAGVGSNRT